MKTLFHTPYGRCVCLDPSTEGLDWVTTTGFSDPLKHVGMAPIHTLIDEREKPAKVVNATNCDCASRKERKAS